MAATVGCMRFDLALVLGAENFRQDGINNHEWSRSGGAGRTLHRPCDGRVPQFPFYREGEGCTPRQQDRLG